MNNFETAIVINIIIIIIINIIIIIITIYIATAKHLKAHKTFLGVVEKCGARVLRNRHVLPVNSKLIFKRAFRRHRCLLRIMELRLRVTPTPGLRPPGLRRHERPLRGCERIDPVLADLGGSPAFPDASDDLRMTSGRRTAAERCKKKKTQLNIKIR